MSRVYKSTIQCGGNDYDFFMTISGSGELIGMEMEGLKHDFEALVESCGLEETIRAIKVAMEADHL